MLHVATRKLMKYGRSLVLVVPHKAALDMKIAKGDVFVVTFDDEHDTLTYQPFTRGGVGPGIDFNGRSVTPAVMP